MKITAAIVTYNRLEFLKRLLTALKNQTHRIDRIVVVNNSSTDGTAEFLLNCEGIEVITQANTGSSGGQFTSAKYCWETGSEWIWLMDDDVIPRPDCLEKLIINITPDRIHAPIRLNPDGLVNQGDTLKLNYTNPFKSVWAEIIDIKIPEVDYLPAQGVTFEGPLFNRNLISTIGLPEHDYFIYGDDTDFFSRAVKKGFKLHIIRSAVIDRLLSVNKSSEFDWKSYYMIRNQIVLDVLNAPFHVRILRPFGYFITWLLRAGSLKNALTVIQASWDGYFYKSNPKNIEFNKKNNIRI